MNVYLLAFFGGFAGSFHCIGMCGGFACGLANANTGSKRLLLLKNVMYNSGRLMSYMFIGALSGILGTTVLSKDTVGTVASQPNESMHSTMSHHAMQSVLGNDLGFAQRSLSVIAGLLMFVMALELLGLRRHVPASWGRIGGVAVARVLNTLVRSNRLSASVALGVINGFLPCPLVIAFVAVAAASADLSVGILTMMAFGLGTFPAMFLMSGIGLVISPVIRRKGVRFAGVFVLLMSLFTVSRGLFAGVAQ